MCLFLHRKKKKDFSSGILYFIMLFTLLAKQYSVLSNATVFRLGRGRVVAFYRSLPKHSPFSSYAQLKIYWKNTVIHAFSNIRFFLLLKYDKEYYLPTSVQILFPFFAMLFSLKNILKICKLA